MQSSSILLILMMEQLFHLNKVNVDSSYMESVCCLANAFCNSSTLFIGNCEMQLTQDVISTIIQPNAMRQIEEIRDGRNTNRFKW